MANLTIITNNRPRDLLCLADIPKHIAIDEFGYIDSGEFYTPRIVAYRGAFYDVNEFTRTPNNEPARQELNDLSAWDGYQSNSYFSGVVLRYVDNFERVIVGRYYS